MFCDLFTQVGALDFLLVGVRVLQNVFGLRFCVWRW
jgi:hypothetical protein